MKKHSSQMLCALLASALYVANAADIVTIPEAIVNYCMAKSALSVKDHERLANDFGDIEFGFSMLYFQKTVDFRDQKSVAWLVGYQLGTLVGNAATPLYGTAYLDKDGNAIQEIPEGGEYGFILKLGPNLWSVALARNRGKPYCGEVKIIDLKLQKTLFSDRCPSGENGEATWDAEFYFIKDNISPRIVIERIFKTNPSKKEYLDYRFDFLNNQYIDETTISKIDETKTAIIKNDKTVIVLKQYGPPIED